MQPAHESLFSYRCVFESRSNNHPPTRESFLITKKGVPESSTKSRRQVCKSETSSSSSGSWNCKEKWQHCVCVCGGLNDVSASVYKLYLCDHAGFVFCLCSNWLNERRNTNASGGPFCWLFHFFPISVRGSSSSYSLRYQREHHAPGSWEVWKVKTIGQLEFNIRE